MTKRKPRKNRGRSRQQRKPRAVSQTEITLLSLALWVGLGIIAIVSLQPWLKISHAIVETISIIPFYDTLAAIPVFSRVINFLDNVGDNLLSSIVGVVIAIGSNYAQVQGGSKASLKQWVVRVLGGVLELGVCIHHHAPYQGGLEAMMLDMPNLDAYMVDVPALFMTILNVIMFEVVFIVGWDYINELKQQVKKQDESANDKNQSAAAA